MKRLICIAITALAPAAWAAPEDSYAGQQHREIKSLSVEERADLLAGRGMGLAKAGELNGYPGPRHVLDLAAQLSLSTNQRTATEAVFSKMQTRAKELGAEIIEAEQALDRAFAAG